MKNFSKKLVSFSKEPVVKSHLLQFSRPNFWSIIEYGKQSYETRYSRMLRWLLDPHENHGLSNLFAQELLNEIGTSVHLLPSKVSGCQAEKKRIDIFYYNEKSGTTLTIELKVNSQDHNQGSSEDSQLDAYYKRVTEDVIYGNGKNYPNHYFIYLTIDGEEPTTKPRTVEHWKNVSYEQLVAVINRVLIKVDNLDVMKIIADFKHDLEKYIAINALDMDTISEAFSEEEQAYIRVLGSYLFAETTDTADGEELYRTLQQEVFSHMDSTNLEKCLKLLYDKFKIGKQDHTPNQSVQMLMRKLFNHYAENQISEEAKPVPSEKRLSPLQVNHRERLPYQAIDITRGKGQGLRFYDADTKEESVYDAYISGDKSGKLNVFAFHHKDVKGAYYLHSVSNFSAVEVYLTDEKEWQNLIKQIDEQLVKNYGKGIDASDS